MINGFPIGNNFGNIATNLNVIINHALLESGNQQLKIQVHPPYHEDGTAQALSDQEMFSLRILRSGPANGQQQTPETVYEFNLQDQERYRSEESREVKEYDVSVDH